jgi:hypothetical protein
MNKRSNPRECAQTLFWVKLFLWASRHARG